MLASIGIVCLDEFDKIASGQNNAIFAGAGTTKDVTGMGVQRELLKMLEASEVVVPLDLTHSILRRPRRDVDGGHRVHRRRRVLRLPADRPPPRDARLDRLRPRPGRRRRPIPTRSRSTSPPSRSRTSPTSRPTASCPSWSRASPASSRSRRSTPSTLKDILRTDVIARMTREFKLEGFELVDRRRPCSITSSATRSSARPARAAWPPR